MLSRRNIKKAPDHAINSQGLIFGDRGHILPCQVLPVNFTANDGHFHFFVSDDLSNRFSLERPHPAPSDKRCDMPMISIFESSILSKYFATVFFSH